ncbi:PhzF family phenazine biosynthesis protein [Steroidobacter sp. S1-65]|uniref:PhzF family phenazine biosynthesis protein n=1 Tax=Steroidobacter gossypii TaxID=2805490 RepID=A0ABS1X5H5_9GAMM|nr:PhzF family phenazine biosynthesis protein [Steroidobacter gossypii]MBM0108458.1 PhzF family phenazine biosynthesis protein [Steroidobacter gossypii]
MSALSFRIVNVFTFNGGTLTGNPLCVFEEASELDTQTMQALARQFNLSETTFILPASGANAHVRIFTPSYEMPFAGHPTLGTAFVCRAMGLGGDELKLQMKAGVIPVRAKGDRWTLQANEPTWRECEASRETLAHMLGLQADDIGERPLWVKAGKEQLVIPLKSEDAVRRARPQPEAFANVRSEEGHSMAYIFAPPANGRTLARFFFPDGAAILEDPATGSATANFGGWWIATGQPLPCQLQISQGEYVSRPSSLFLDVDAQRRIFVSGDVVEIARGTLKL